MIDDQQLIDRIEQIIIEKLYVDPETYISDDYMDNSKEVAKQVVHEVYSNVINVLEKHNRRRLLH